MPDTGAAEWAGLRAQVAEAGAVLAAAGQGDLVWGHLAVRDPAGRGVWMKRAGVGLDEARAADIILVSPAGEVLSGEGARHIEFHIHTSLLAARSDATAVVHTHPPHAVAFAARDTALLPISHDGTLFVPPDVPRFSDTGDLVATAELGAALARTVGDRPAALMPRHGIVAVGGDIPSAVMTAVLLERACRVQLLASAAGEVLDWSDEPEALAKRQHCWSAGQLAAGYAYLVRRLARG